VVCLRLRIKKNPHRRHFAGLRSVDSTTPGGCSRRRHPDYKIFSRVCNSADFATFTWRLLDPARTSPRPPTTNVKHRAGTRRARGLPRGCPLLDRWRDKIESTTANVGPSAGIHHHVGRNEDPPRRADEMLLPAVRGVLPRGHGRAVLPGVPSIDRRAPLRHRALIASTAPARRCLAACCLGCWYTMLCYTPKDVPVPAGAPAAVEMER